MESILLAVTGGVMRERAPAIIARARREVQDGSVVRIGDFTRDSWLSTIGVHHGAYVVA